MKIAPGAADKFAAAPPEAICAVLIYGPDGGLVRERADRVIAAIVEDPRDPFRVSELRADALRSDPALLLDEAGALSLTGGGQAKRSEEAKTQ